MLKILTVLWLTLLVIVTCWVLSLPEPTFLPAGMVDVTAR